MIGLLLTLRSLQAPAARCLAAADSLAARAGAFVLMAIALGYYSLYWRHGLNLGGEGGTAAVIAMRLNEGMRPIADTFLGYNVLWFYPIAEIFRWTGPDYLALRAYFFLLCGLTGLLGFWTVLRLTRSGLLALLTGLSLVLIPGMIFRNYMGLLGVGNQLAFAMAFLAPPSSSAKRIAMIVGSGAVVGLTFLVRVEIGWLMLAIWVALLVLALAEPGGQNRRAVGLGFLGGLLAMLLAHAPFAADAARRGYAGEFWGQYTSYFALVRWELKKLSSQKKPPQVPSSQQEPAGLSSAANPSPQQAVQARRPKPGLSAIWSERRARDRFFAAAVHLPVVLAVGLVIGGASALILGFAKKDWELWRSGLAIGTLTGCALTLFPQYYFFRPDTPHITEFMVPFQVAMAVAAGLCLQRARRQPTRLSIAMTGLAFSAAALIAWVHFGHAWRKESAGTLAARTPNSVEFFAKNNVRVLLPPQRAAALEGLRDAIQEHSSPGDWVVCLPYSPTINFMTDRPSYLWDLYMDNTLASPDFEKEKIAEMEKHDPAVVVVDHRPINKVEASRFPKWAPVWYAHLRSRYGLAGTFEGNEVFVRRIRE